MIPEFTLADQNGKIFNSHEYIGIKNMVLFFYPMNGTPICTIDACSFRNNYLIFVANDFEIIGISSDSSKSHKTFKKLYRLPYRLLSDEDGEIRKMMQVPRSCWGLLPGRAAYLVGKDGRVVKIIHSFFGLSGKVRRTIELLRKDSPISYTRG